MTDTDTDRAATREDTLTEEEMAALEEQYAPDPAPTNCRVCGAPLAIAAAGNGEITWVCTAASRDIDTAALGTREHKAAWGHYDTSQAIRRSGDRRVVCVLSELRRLRAENERLRGIIFTAANAAIAAMTPEERAAYDAELRLWDVTLADGLDIDTPAAPREERAE